MKRLFALLLALCLLCGAALAADLPEPSDDFYVYDGANVIDYETEGHIVFCNDVLAEACGAQIVFVTVDTVGNASIDDYALELFNAWDIGDAQKQNGFLVLMAIDDDNYYALPGTGLDLELSAGVIKQYLDEHLEPDFADKDYDAGARKLFDALFERIAEICDANVTLAEGDARFEAYLATDDGAQEYEERRVAQEQYAPPRGGCTLIGFDCIGCTCGGFACFCSLCFCCWPASAAVLATGAIAASILRCIRAPRAVGGRSGADRAPDSIRIRLVRPARIAADLAAIAAASAVVRAAAALVAVAAVSVAVPEAAALAAAVPAAAVARAAAAPGAADN